MRVDWEGIFERRRGACYGIVIGTSIDIAILQLVTESET